MKGLRKGVFLFLDFDGTISNIARNPKDAVVRPDAKKWLKGLLKKRGVKIAVITGRSLPDIRRRVRLQGLYYIANHGMEAFYQDRFLLRRGRQFEKPLKNFGDEMISVLSHIPGILIEEKGLSVAVHFRQLDKKYHGIVKEMVYDVAEPFIKKNKLQLTKGKMILELRPAEFWGKGSAVLWLWKKAAPKYFPIYIGDDVTDEDAFKALRKHGLTIRVGKKKGTNAEYYVRSIKDVM